MQWLSLLFVCLLATQTVQARHLSAKPNKVPNKQWLQLTLSFSGVTCADIPTSTEKIVRLGARDSVKAYLESQGVSSTIVDSTKGVKDRNGPGCQDTTVGATTYASVRVAVSYVGLPTTAETDFLFKAFKQGACKAGYDQTVFAILADAITNAGLTVANNKASRTNPWSPKKGWIAFVTPDNCATTTPSPPPSPAPASPAPVNSTSPAPSNSTSPAPSNTTSPAPSNTTSPAPSNSTSPAPSNSTSPAPVNSTSPAPSNTTSPSPTPSNTTSPSPTPSNTTSPSPAPESPSPVPDSPSPVPDSPSPVPDSPSPVPESPSPSPVP